jgi:hypothetical protein
LDLQDYYVEIIDNILTEHECSHLIDITNDESGKHHTGDRGYTTALVNEEVHQGIRKSGRCMIDSVSFATKLWERVIAVFNSRDPNSDDSVHSAQRQSIHTGAVVHYSAVELNERLRFLKYVPGGYFATHRDGSYSRTPHDAEERQRDKSLVTCQLYLNQGFKGGSTRLGYSDSDSELNVFGVADEDGTASAPPARMFYDVVPTIGRVVLFDHRCLHQGLLVEEGIKYAMRTDVMYRPVKM